MSFEQDEATAPEILEQIEIDDLGVLRRLANPMRLRILFHFRTPHSVAEVADLLDVPVTRLYYHVKILHEAGVILVVGTRKRGPQLEKVYRIVAHAIRPSARILEHVDDPTEFAEVAAALVLDSARAELVSSLAQHAAAGFDPDTINGTLGRTIVSVPPDRVGEFIAHLEELAIGLKDDEGDTADGVLYGFTYSFFPLEAPNAKEQTR